MGENEQRSRFIRVLIDISLSFDVYQMPYKNRQWPIGKSNVHTEVTIIDFSLCEIQLQTMKAKSTLKHF